MANRKHFCSSTTPPSKLFELSYYKNGGGVPNYWYCNGFTNTNFAAGYYGIDGFSETLGYALVDP